jgi:hypothetical protein
VLPDPLFYTPTEPLMGSDESVCDPNAHRPGVLAFKDFVLEQLGGGSYGTARPCVPGQLSGHHSARAWDWAMDASDPDDVARVNELLEWLTANGAELFRRAGLSYMIWNKRSWSALRPEWRPYDGFDEEGKCAKVRCRDPHTNHVHFSFNWPGAEGETSFYQWLASGRPVKPPVVPPGPPAKPFKPVDFAARVVPLLAGAVLGFVGFEHARERWRRA